VLFAAASIMVVLVGAFAYALVISQGRCRRQAEESFAVQAMITAELTSSLFTSSATSVAAQAVKAFGHRTVTSTQLDSAAKRSHLAYLLILGSDGRVLAASAGTPAAVRDRAPRSPSHIRAALAGNAWLSNVLTGVRGGHSVIEWAFPFQTALGRRVEVEAFDAGVLSGFLQSYLKQRGGNNGQVGYVVDSRQRLVADSSGLGKPGELARASAVRDGRGRYSSGGVERYVTSAPLPGSDWRIVLSEPTSTH
jgi:hypothetical protein